MQIPHCKNIIISSYEISRPKISCSQIIILNGVSTGWHFTSYTDMCGLLSSNYRRAHSMTLRNYHQNNIMRVRLTSPAAATLL